MKNGVRGALVSPTPFRYKRSRYLAPSALAARA